MAVRATEWLFALAMIQQSAEHLAGPARGRLLFGGRMALAVALLVGVGVPWVMLLWVGTQARMLVQFGGPYNGGSDRMGGLIGICLLAVHWTPEGLWREAAFGYLGVQLVVCYVMSGKVKLANADWRSGAALRDVFAFSAYPVSAQLRAWAGYPRAMWAASWAVIVFEVGFVAALVSPPVLVGALGVAAGFHLANACVFGLNRFLWIWIAAFPALLWLQGRVLGAG